jgi:hypothetical protein
LSETSRSIRAAVQSAEGSASIVFDLDVAPYFPKHGISANAHSLVQASTSVDRLEFSHPLKPRFTVCRSRTTGKIDEEPAPVSEFTLHGVDHSAVTEPWFLIRFLFDLDYEEVFAIMPALMDNYIREDEFLATTATLRWKLDFFRIKTMPVVFDVHGKIGKVRLQIMR